MVDKLQFETDNGKYLSDPRLGPPCTNKVNEVELKE